MVTEVDVIYSGPVNLSEADNIATYRLATPGKKNSYTAKSRGHYQAQEGGGILAVSKHSRPDPQEAVRPHQAIRN